MWPSYTISDKCDVVQIPNFRKYDYFIGFLKFLNNCLMKDFRELVYSLSEKKRKEERNFTMQLSSIEKIENNFVYLTFQRNIIALITNN